MLIDGASAQETVIAIRQKKLGRSIQIDVVGLLVLAISGFIFGAVTDAFERLHDFFQAYEEWELDETFFAVVTLNVGLTIFAIRRWLELRRELHLRAEAEEKLRILYQKANEATLSRGRFIANMSHEIRTPLTAIIGCADSFDRDELTPAGRKLVDLILKEGEHLQAMLTDVLDHAKIELGGITLTPRPTHLPTLLEDVAQVYQPSAQAKGLHLETDISPETPANIEVDSLRLTQVLLNLLSNAVKYTQSGSIQLRCEAISGFSLTSRIRLSVIDTGIGIPEDKQVTIFDAFEQSDSSLTKAYQGCGLGTTIVKSLVEHMGGEVGLESVEHYGSTFWVELPVRITTEEAVRESMCVSQELPDTPIERRARILLAEDYEVTRDIIKGHLDEMGVDTMVVENGKVAYQRALNNRFDLIILDIQMPVMDGITAAGKIRSSAMNAQTPIIGLSANADPSLSEACRQKGMQDLMIKPIRKAALTSEVRKWLDRAPFVNSPAASESLSGEAAQSDPQSAIAPLDVDAAIVEFGSTEKVIELTNRLLKSVEQQLRELNLALQGQNRSVLKQQAHKLFGGAGTLEAQPLARAAKQLEELSDFGEPAELNLSYDRIEREYGRLLDYVRQTLQWQAN